MPETKKRKGLFWTALAGATVIVTVGIALVFFPMGDGLGRLSYDLPFCIRSGVPDELVMVYLNQNVKASLGVPLDRPLARSYHTRLLQRLKLDRPKLVFYDIIFDEPDEDTEVDSQFAKAIEEHGAVVLVGDYEKELTGNVFAEVLRPPIPALRNEAAGWGLARLSPDPDNVIRKLDAGAENCSSAAWVAAKLLQAKVAQDESRRLDLRWLNYYGPPNAFRSVNFDQALDVQGLPAGYFRDKIVVVGSSPSVGLVGAGREDFGTPYSRFGSRLSSGAQIHAVTLVNLLRDDWLEQLSTIKQLGLATVWGLLVGVGLMLVRPWHAAWLAVAGIAVIGMASFYVQLYHNVWWPWLILAAVQTPLALVWSVGWQYTLESRRRKKLRQAFAGYLSPHLADRIADEEFNLSLGGKVVEATVMFTDLEGFTALSENLSPDEVSRILTTYFNQTTCGILEQEGTIIKYMGDAVMAVWGAPLADPKQAERAVLAAWKMIHSGRTEIAGYLLRTRIGINSGPVLAGNLGSDFRFDYAAIGNTTNTASRLESLNKQFGTNILISEATLRQLDPRFRTRALGRVRVTGKSQPVTIHEVLGLDLPPAEPSPWLPLFEEALRSFTGFKLDQAAKLFSQVIELRGGQDGPSEFYLKEIAAARANPLTIGSWDGVVVLSSK